MPTRLPLLTDAQVGPPDLVAAIRQRRGGELLDLDRLLLHSPAFAVGWNAFMGRVRSDLGIPPLLRELAMCGVAALNDADFEMHHHAPLYLAAGASEAQLALLHRLGAEPGLADDPVFDPTQQAVLALVVEMTRQVRVGDATFARARAAMGSDQAMFELVGVIAAYNMVSRILLAMTLTP
ncbi:MAG: carboxymuconolactone decarboxylase family protein [Pseudomonadota bacterium]